VLPFKKEKGAIFIAPELFVPPCNSILIITKKSLKELSRKIKEYKCPVEI